MEVPPPPLQWLTSAGAGSGRSGLFNQCLSLHNAYLKDMGEPKGLCTLIGDSMTVGWHGPMAEPHSVDA